MRTVYVSMWYILKYIPLVGFLAWQMAVQTSAEPRQKAEDGVTEPTPRLINIIDRSSVLTALTQKARADTSSHRHGTPADRESLAGGYSKNLIISSLARGSSTLATN